jgi:hypothetical protein
VLSSSSFEGIGFYRSNVLEGGVTFVAKQDLHVVSDPNTKLKLKNSNEEAVVLRFVMYMPGTAGNSGTGWCMDSVVFKPFAQFTNGPDTFQNWEAANDTRIYRCANGAGRPQVTSIDRSGDLLAK